MKEILATALGVLLSAVFKALTAAQQNVAPSRPAIDATTLQDLAKDIQNPLAESLKLPFEFTTGFRIGPHHNAGENLNIQPVLLFSLNTNWDVIVRPLLPVTYAPSPHEKVRARGLAVLRLPDARKRKDVDLGCGTYFPISDRYEPGIGDR